MQWIWGSAPKTISAPAVLKGAIDIFGIRYPLYRVFLIGLAVISGAGLWIFWERSKLGAVVRACVDDRDMAAAMGISVDRVTFTVFSIGSAVAGLTGVLGGPVIGVSIGLDFDILLLAVVVMVVGGLGSLGGAFLASILVGLIDAFGKASFPELSYFTIFAPVIVILLVRPSGLFGKAFDE